MIYGIGDYVRVINGGVFVKDGIIARVLKTERLDIRTQGVYLSVKNRRGLSSYLTSRDIELTTSHAEIENAIEEVSL